MLLRNLLAMNLLCLSFSTAALGAEIPQTAATIDFDEPVRVGLRAREFAWYQIRNQDGARLGELVSLDEVPLDVEAFNAAGEPVGDASFRLLSEPVYLRIRHRFGRDGQARVRLAAVPDVDFLEPNDNPAEATRLQPGRPIRAQLFPQIDQDVYRIDVGVQGYLTPHLVWEGEVSPSMDWELLNADGERLGRLASAQESFLVEPGTHWLRPRYRFSDLQRASHIVRVDFAPMVDPDRATVTASQEIHWQPATSDPRTFVLQVSEAGWVNITALHEPIAAEIRLNGKRFQGPVWVEPGTVELGFKGAYGNYSTAVARHRVEVITASAAAAEEATLAATLSQDRPAYLSIDPGSMPWYIQLGEVDAPFHSHPVPERDQLKLEVAVAGTDDFQPITPDQISSVPGPATLRISLETEAADLAPVFVDVAVHVIEPIQPPTESRVSVSVIDLSQTQSAALRDMALSSGAQFIALQDVHTVSQAVAASMKSEIEPQSAAGSNPFVGALWLLIAGAVLCLGAGLWWFRAR